MDLQNCYVEAFGFCVELLNIKKKQRTKFLWIWNCIIMRWLAVWQSHESRGFEFLWKFHFDANSSSFIGFYVKRWDNELLNYGLLSWKMAWKNRWWERRAQPAKSEHQKNLTTQPTECERENMSRRDDDGVAFGSCEQRKEL